MEPLKNMFNREVIEKIAAEITNEYNNFNSKSFINSCLDENWESLELKERMHHIALMLGKHLPEYPIAIEILKKVKPNFNGFESITLPDFVETFGLDYFEESIEALRLFTINSSSEFAVRPFIIQYGQKMMDVMYKWSEDENEHVRRLSSEGCRPRLPWAIALPGFKKDPSPVLPVLEKLKDDPSEYVRKSVANNLNDISKDHPDIVLHIARKWLGFSTERDKIIKHALRTMLKKGNSDALGLFGFGNSDDVEVTNFALSNNSPRIGEEFIYSFDVKNRSGKTQKIRCEYIVDFVKKTGKTSPKIFQVFEKEFAPDEIVNVSRKHSFLNRTTRTHYPGKHAFTVVINGIKTETLEFQLS